MAQDSKNPKISSGKKSKVSAEDEWAHLAEADTINTKIEAAIAADVEDRSQTFGDSETKDGLKTQQDKIKEMSKIGESTAEYIDNISEHLSKQTKHIDKLKKLNEQFDQDIAMLQPGKKESRPKPRPVQTNETVQPKPKTYDMKPDIPQESKTFEQEIALIIKHDLIPLLEKHGIEKMITAMQQFFVTVKSYR